MICDHLHGRDTVGLLLNEVNLSREDRRKAIRELKRVGLAELAEFLKAHPKRSLAAPKGFDERWNTDLRRDGTLRGFQKHSKT